MDGTYGTCRFCGQTRMVVAADQQDADIKVSGSCTCPESKLLQKQQRIREIVQGICGDDGAELGFMQLDAQQIEVVQALAEMTVSGRISGVTLRTEESFISIGRSADVELKISRKRIESMEAKV